MCLHNQLKKIHTLNPNQRKEQMWHLKMDPNRKEKNHQLQKQVKVARRDDVKSERQEYLDCLGVG